MLWGKIVYLGDPPNKLFSGPIAKPGICGAQPGICGREEGGDEHCAGMSSENEGGHAASSREDQRAASDMREKSETPRGMIENRNSERDKNYISLIKRHSFINSFILIQLRETKTIIHFINPLEI
jgi:hypothetical protein